MPFGFLSTPGLVASLAGGLLSAGAVLGPLPPGPVLPGPPLSHPLPHPGASRATGHDRAPRQRGVWPLGPRHEVVHGFEPPESAWGPGHRGVDLRGRPGQVVRATMDGTVSFAGTLAGRGVVVVDHGATRTTYEPVTASVDVGDRVGAGRPIGRLQLPMSHCFPEACLHWGLIRGDTYLDPLTLVGAGPVRLLPMFT